MNEPVCGLLPPPPSKNCMMLNMPAACLSGRYKCGWFLTCFRSSDFYIYAPGGRWIYLPTTTTYALVESECRATT